MGLPASANRFGSRGSAHGADAVSANPQPALPRMRLRPGLLVSAHCTWPRRDVVVPPDASSACITRNALLRSGSAISPKARWRTGNAAKSSASRRTRTPPDRSHGWRRSPDQRQSPTSAGYRALICGAIALTYPLVRASAFRDGHPAYFVCPVLLPSRHRDVLQARDGRNPAPSEWPLDADRRRLVRTLLPNSRTSSRIPADIDSSSTSRPGPGAPCFPASRALPR